MESEQEGGKEEVGPRCRHFYETVIKGKLSKKLKTGDKRFSNDSLSRTNFFGSRWENLWMFRRGA